MDWGYRLSSVNLTIDLKAMINVGIYSVNSANPERLPTLDNGPGYAYIPCLFRVHPNVYWAYIPSNPVSFRAGCNLKIIDLLLQDSFPKVDLRSGFAVFS